jgi:TPR repeat protein
MDFDSAAEAEARYRRMWRLQRMSAAELRVLLAAGPVEAAAWIETAARYGVAEAQTRLGQMLLDGIGLDRDQAAALGWFTRAAEKGDPEGMNMVGRCLENGWGASVELAAAAAWYSLSATAGDDWGAYNYANMLCDGRGVACDRPQAVVWYRRAAENGHARAMNLLARCYEEAWGTPRDERQAYMWYDRSAKRGYFRAQYNLATVLAARGRITEALGWFEKALRAATPDSLPGMAEALTRHGDRRLAELASRFAGPQPMVR